MKEITTNGKTILFVEVPEDGTEFWINDIGCIRYSFENWSKCIEPQEIGVYLKKDEYQILGKSTELSEEQMKEICEFDGENYKCYLVNDDSWHSVRDSYISLLEANGIVDRNNASHPSDIMPQSLLHYEQIKQKWQEAQSKVKHYLVLKRI